MDKSKIESIEILDELIIGKVDPYIYAFKTNTVPNYLKVGDTYRPVSKRIEEWKRVFPNLEKQYENKAIIDDETYFRDYSVHKYLENDLKKERLLLVDIPDDVYYSREFFKNTKTTDIDEAIKDIEENYKANTNKYEYYSSKGLPKTFHYERGECWNLRPNQKEVVKNFIKAINSGRKNLLMYAVMRFGKSFTSMCCALAMEAKLVVIVSAKADVKDEWKRTVESAGNFEEYKFLESDDLLREEDAIKKVFSENKRVALFLTLQDLQGKNIKEKHKELFDSQIDLLIVDETHFGARAESYGAILKNAGYDKADERNIKKLDDDHVEVKDADEEIKKINARIRIHLSGTPYRILMGSEFEKEDIISFVQFSDIVREQEKWDEEHLKEDDINEWDNPYFGFPQMIRFAFNPNESSRRKMEELKKQGVSYTLSKLLEPESIKLDKENNKHKKFKNQSEILDLLKIIDGSKEDDGLLGFLDYDKIKEGKMCRHMVMVLPYCAACDAMEELIENNRHTFKNLNGYEIVNISGLESFKLYKHPQDIKNKIKDCEKNNQKTITLTVNRMLTGSTVEQWDTMLYFKDTSSPQEYDQSIFRLQNQHTRTLYSKNSFIKENLKPQTLLVDFDPNRLFKMQEQKSLIYNVNTEENGNSKLKERMEEEIRISPIIMMNHNKIKEVTATDILEVISEYSSNISVADEVLEIPVDFSILNDHDVKKVMYKQGEFNSKKGLSYNPNEGEGDDYDFGNDEPGKEKPDGGQEEGKDKESSESTSGNDTKKIANKIKTYYQRILFYTFLTRDKVISLDDILQKIESEDNARIAKNLYIEKDILEKIGELMDPFIRSRLDYSIQKISQQSHDESLEPIERAMRSLRRFNIMSESEVVTPTKVSTDMVNLLPEEGLREIVESNEKFLDIGCKAGEYAVALYKRLTDELGYRHDQVCNIIYAIPTSSMAYEFTRKFYEILGLNIDNIAYRFNAYDLLEIKDKDNKMDYEKIKDLLEQDYKFCEIDLDNKVEAGDKKVKFGAVVGNPPYQENNTNRNRDDSIYHYFYDAAFNLSDIVTYITPARFLFNIGSTSKDWNNKMLSDKHFCVKLYEQNSDKIFPGRDINGGLAITLRDKNKILGPIGEFTSFKELDSILDKVSKISELDVFGKIMYVQLKFNLDALLLDYPEYKDRIGNNKERRLVSSSFDRFPEVFHDDKRDGDISVIGRQNNQRVFRFINKEYIQDNGNLGTFKVILPAANGSGAIGEVLSTPLIGEPLIGEPLIGHTQTFISLGNFDDEYKAKALLKYVKSKFARTMLGIRKITQNNKTSETWSKVPLQDFTENSDIDWTKSIPEIDQQLYKKYGLSQEEINFIEEKVAPME